MARGPLILQFQLLTLQIITAYFSDFMEFRGRNLFLFGGRLPTIFIVFKDKS